MPDHLKYGMIAVGKNKRNKSPKKGERVQSPSKWGRSTTYNQNFFNKSYMSGVGLSRSPVRNRFG